MNMIITTTETIPNKTIAEILGVARGSTVRARNIGRDIFAGLQSKKKEITFLCLRPTWSRTLRSFFLKGDRATLGFTKKEM